MERFRLNILVKSRIRRKVYVRFGGEHWETDYSNMVRRWVLKFPDLSTIAYNHLLNNQSVYKKVPRGNKQSSRLDYHVLFFLLLAFKKNQKSFYKA